MAAQASQGQMSTKSQRNFLTPSLFVGPPQGNASNTSLQLVPSQQSQSSSNLPSRTPLQKQRSNLGERPMTAENSSIDGYHNSVTGSPTSPTTNSSTPISRGLRKDIRRNKPSSLSTNLSTIQDNLNSTRQQQPSNRELKPGGGKEQDNTEAVWAEMQSTLEEVELGAANGPSVFHRNHARALEELRHAQIDLAQAWARSESAANDNSDGMGMNLDRMKHSEFEVTDALADERMDKINIGGHGGDTGKEKSQKGNKFSRPGTASSTAQRSQLDEETENDILLARKRRQANDKYFEKVNKGVMDVVAKLELVAKEMGAVEKESQEIWGDADSLESKSEE